ncbi:MAG: DUF6798 domain-containing protein [Candidatus Sulfotelmatobacter sp.]|jgi:hypothetical protein
MQVSPNSSAQPNGRGDFSARNLFALACLTVFAFLVMGYHPGLEDDSFYLAAIKRDLNPALFPHDSDFFRLQFQATIFDKLIAFSARLTHLPVTWIVLLWQVAAIFFLLHGCWRIARRCFAAPEAHWATTTLIAAILTLPLPGIAINLADQYLHPRTLATALVLGAIVAIVDRRPWLAGLLLAIAFSIHAIMASFGISFCVFLWWSLGENRRKSTVPITAALVPLGWLFEPASDAWRQAAATRGFYFLTRWHWYEWLGVFAPLALLFAVRRFLQARRDASDNSALLPLTSSLIYYGVFQMIVGLAIMLPPGLERLRPFEPMRYLHLLYLLFFLIVGGLLGRYVLHRSFYRWLLLFVPLASGMLYAQRQMYPASTHLEMPWVAPSNPWLQAFAWIRANTPTDALFALDPHYESLPAEDAHGFRALAERSALADYQKDGGMAARVPRLAPRWLNEVTAVNDWKDFRLADFARLKKDLAVTWVVLSRADAQFSVAQPEGMTCPYANGQVRVCRLY